LGDQRKVLKEKENLLVNFFVFLLLFRREDEKLF